MISQPHLIARVRPEFARGERDRCCHFFPLPADGAMPVVLSAYCGFHIHPGEAEPLDAPAGMPCTGCLMAAALSS
ncbi:hypothetical protein ABT337_18090 [Saccharopolyspora hirsuta]|uniref:Uncharacterized protein n=1 Tax=Saccharopolyspora hirsuta TaxID=1837 RepID=A0A5M7BG71_SACHI|nr:hypothetical protein [Saccharopolyspora hirsuta]KAA5828666.1 hypothetical protein F1721_26870 [Saccharopolyspora hirsuta]